MKRKFAPVMITAAALITTVPTTQVFASEGINAETASDNITPLVINTENTQNTAQTSTEDTTQNAQEVNKQQTSQTEEVTPESDKEQKTTSGSGSCTGRYSGNLGSHVVRGRNEP